LKTLCYQAKVSPFNKQLIDFFALCPENYLTGRSTRTEIRAVICNTINQSNNEALLKNT
jgi:hypothetical protein